MTSQVTQAGLRTRPCHWGARHRGPITAQPPAVRTLPEPISGGMQTCARLCARAWRRCVGWSRCQSSQVRGTGECRSRVHLWSGGVLRKRLLEKLAMEAVLQVSPAPGQIHVGTLRPSPRGAAGGRAACLSSFLAGTCVRPGVFLAAAPPLAKADTQTRGEEGSRRSDLSCVSACASGENG